MRGLRIYIAKSLATGKGKMNRYRQQLVVMNWLVSRIFTGFSNLSLPKKYRETNHVTTHLLKVSKYQLVPASTQRSGNGYYSSEPFQARP